jgi:hypothetical protein
MISFYSDTMKKRSVKIPLLLLMKWLHGRSEEIAGKRIWTKNLHASILMRRCSSVMSNNLIFMKIAENK